MKYEVTVYKLVAKFLKQRPGLKSRFGAKVKLLQCGDFSQAGVEKVVGKKSDYRFRVGKYRFVFELEKEQLRIHLYNADSRGQIYK